MIKNKYKLAIKSSLLLIGALHLSINVGLCGHFDLDEINRVEYKTHYNSLSSVEENDALLNSSYQFHSFLKEAEEIITRYELESVVGLRLIHRHFTLDEGQVMTEGYETIDGVPSLVTYAHKFEAAEEKVAVPSSWIFSGNSEDEVLLFEASNDSAVKTNHLKLQQSPDFFDEIGKVLVGNNLQNLLSVAVLKRHSLLAQDDQIYMEVNYNKSNKSVVQLWNKKDQIDNTIRTSWSFKGPKEQLCLPYFYCWRIFQDKHIHNVVHTIND